MPRFAWAIPALVLASSSFAQSGPADVSKLGTDLKFDSLYPRRPFSGKGAVVQGWSPDDRYCAFLWNGYKDHGMDLWLYDSKTGKEQRLTSIALMAGFDRTIRQSVDRYRKDDERLDKWDTLEDAEYRKRKEQYREDQQKLKEPEPSYPGIAEAVWAHKADELLFTCKGDVYKWKVGADKPERLTQSREGRSQIEYLPDDKGYVFRSGDGVFRVQFDSSVIRELTPKFPDGQTLGGFHLSPDGNYLLVEASKSTGPERQVDYLDYEGRFAQDKKTSREVADGEFKESETLYLVDCSPKALDETSGDGKPVQLYSWPGGTDYQVLSIDEHPFSKDSSHVAYASWKRDEHELQIWDVNTATGKAASIYKGTSNGEHTTPTLTRPFYSNDAKTVYCLLDKSGWRQVHKIDLATKAESAVTVGSFETYPLQVAADGKSILVTTSKDASYRQSVYRVDPSSGAMSSLTFTPGEWGAPAFAHKSDKYLDTMSNWGQMRELFANDLKKDTVLTDSHRSKDFWGVVKLKPQVFTYKNRAGDDISGFMFLPPNFNKAEKHPLFIYVYGGPLGTSHSVEDGSFNSTAYLFNMYLSYVLGYVTVTIDPRGQSGYSAAFGRANFEQPGKNQMEDLVDGVKYMAENYGIDTTKVGITGWSFGGFQTQYCMYNAPDTFTLGIAGAGPTEWQNYNTWYTGGTIGRSRKDHPEDLDKFSLTAVAQNLRSPLLLLHGMVDTNVLFQDTVHVYRKLLQAGKGNLVELALDPTGNHGLGGDVNSHDMHAIFLRFILEQWGMPAKG